MADAQPILFVLDVMPLPPDHPLRTHAHPCVKGYTPDRAIA
jgi:hypothetical protein